MVMSSNMRLNRDHLSKYNKRNAKLNVRSGTNIINAPFVRRAVVV